MKSRGLFAVVVLVAVVLLFPNIAIGQTPILEADCTQDAQCSTLKEQAAECSKRGDLVEALRLYKLAYEVRHDPRLIFNIARLLHRLGKTAEAVAYYQKFIDAPIQDEEQKKKAREYLEQIQAVQTTPKQKQTKQSPSITTNSIPSQAVRVDALPAGKPIYKKWWFWTLLGGAAAAAVVGTAIGVSARQPDLSDVMQYRLMP